MKYGIQIKRTGFAAACLSVLILCCTYPQYPEARSKRTFYGKASYYGKQFHGRKTANGETFDMYALTAAHKSFPFGTVCRVTNRSNSKSVTVRINDRGPFVKGRILDLSYKAADMIGGVQEGVMQVRIDVMKWGTE
ncbi:septal ring lytic transglycosylase RlpA family protein [bacterium]|nr:septal ring lytic transglycosylase RlpA family protein [bacterium]